jgi:hypothetical protein
MKTVAGLRKTKFRGLACVDWAFTFAAAAYNLERAKADRGGVMGASADCEPLRRWRIVEADLWDRDFLDLCRPAYVHFETGGHGEFAFGAVQGGMNLRCGKRSVFFTRNGFDEMDETSGSGSAELDDDGTIEIELSFHNGGDAVLNAVRERFLQQPARRR